MSRNLTFDRSWDVCFAMDSSKSAKTAHKSKPLAHYIEFLCDQVKSTSQNARGKRSSLRRLAEKLSSVSFTTASKEFGDNFEIMPLGIGANAYDMSNDPLFCSNTYAADYTFHELVVFSPFLSGSLIDYWNKPEHSLTGTTRVLVTRKSELSKFTKEKSSRFRIYALQDDIVDGEEAISNQDENKQKQDIHAKMYLRKKYSNVDLYLGSMNATYCAVNKNVEMMFFLHTKNRYYNTEYFLKDIFCGKEDNPQNPFELCEATEGTQDSADETADQLEQIVKTVMHATVSERGEKYDVALEINGNLPDVQMYLSPFRRDVLIPLTNSMQFSQLDLLQLSEFYMIKVVLGEAAIERIIMVSISGIPDTRENAVVNNVVKDKRSFVEYVVFVLGDDYLLSLMEDRELKSAGVWNDEHEHFPALYEKMLKTALEDPKRLNEIGYLLNMITDDGIIPDEFRDLYSTDTIDPRYFFPAYQRRRYGQ